MQNIKIGNQIYLSGGGNEKQSFPLDKFFLVHYLKMDAFYTYLLRFVVTSFTLLPICG